MFRFYLYLRCLHPPSPRLIAFIRYYITVGNNAISKCTAGKQMLLQSPVNRRWNDKLINHTTTLWIMLYIKKDHYCWWHEKRICILKHFQFRSYHYMNFRLVSTIKTSLALFSLTLVHIYSKLQNNAADVHRIVMFS